MVMCTVNTTQFHFLFFLCDFANIFGMFFFSEYSKSMSTVSPGGKDKTERVFGTFSHLCVVGSFGKVQQ